MSSRTRFFSWGRVLVILGILLGYPLVMLLLQVGFPHLQGGGASPWQFSLGSFTTFLHDPLSIKALVHTTVLALSVAVGATLVGALLMIFYHRRPPAWPSIWPLLTWILFLAPSYVVAEGFDLMGMPNGLFDRLTGQHNHGIPFLFSPYGVVFVLGIRLLPMAMITIDGALRGMGDEFRDAARTLGANSFTVYIRVILPLLRPALIASFFIVLAEAAGDFGVAATLAYDSHWILLSYLIYQSLNTFPANFGLAAVQSIALMAVVGVAQLLEKTTAKQRARFSVLHGHRRVRAKRRRSWATTAIFSGVFVVGLVIPLLTYLWIASTKRLGLTGLGRLTFHNYTLALRAPLLAGSLSRSVEYALLVAVLALAIGLYLSSMADRELARTVTHWLTATIAIPGLVLGISYIFAWNAGWLYDLHLTLYGTRWVLVLAYTAGVLPFVVRMLSAAFNQIDPNLMSAARVLGIPNRLKIRRITIPLVLPTLGSTFLLVVTGVLFELPASELLYPAGSPTLAVEIVHQFHNFNYGVGAALTLLGMLVALAFTVAWKIVERRLMGNWQQARRDPSETRRDAI